MVNPKSAPDGFRGPISSRIPGRSVPPATSINQLKADPKEAGAPGLFAYPRAIGWKGDQWCARVFALRGSAPPGDVMEYGPARGLPRVSLVT